MNFPGHIDQWRLNMYEIFNDRFYRKWMKNKLWTYIICICGCNPVMTMNISTSTCDGPTYTLTHWPYLLSPSPGNWLSSWNWLPRQHVTVMCQTAFCGRKWQCLRQNCLCSNQCPSATRAAVTADYWPVQRWVNECHDKKATEKCQKNNTISKV